MEQSHLSSGTKSNEKPNKNENKNNEKNKCKKIININKEFMLHISILLSILTIELSLSQKCWSVQCSLDIIIERGNSRKCTINHCRRLFANQNWCTKNNLFTLGTCQSQRKENKLSIHEKSCNLSLQILGIIEDTHFFLKKQCHNKNGNKDNMDLV